jgi:hypothetical protein
MGRLIYGKWNVWRLLIHFTHSTSLLAGVGKRVCLITDPVEEAAELRVSTESCGYSNP